jgi:prepilin-type processing-associated H-X9-DG protein
VASPSNAVLFGDCTQVDAWKNGPDNFQPINHLFWIDPPVGVDWSDLDRDAHLESWPPTDPAYGQIRYRHNGGANLVYLDGHVKWWARGQVQREQFFPAPEIIYDRIGYN